jgi:hypothetical protein
MISERDGEPRPPEKRWTKNKLIFAGVLLILSFLTGFLPGYVKGQRQEKELREARQENRLAQLRDLACLAYLQASQKDYGLAAGTSTRLFDHTREVANQTLGSADRKSLQGLLSLRDPITAKLATGDSGVLNDLQAVLVKTRQASRAVSPSAPHP